MDNQKAWLLIWFLISLVTCMKFIDLSDASSIVNVSHHDEVVSSIQRGTRVHLDMNTHRSGSYQYAVYRKHKEREFIGISGDLNMWLIKVNMMDISGTHIRMGVSQRTYISAGWMVNRQQFNDPFPRFFTSYTTDNFRTVCYSYNNACTGFVTGSSESYYSNFGAPILDGSTYDGQQLYADLEIIQDQITKNWLVKRQLGSENILMGYWKASSFPGLNAGASTIEWGGFVFRSQQSPGPLPMGNGGVSTLGYNKACHIKFMRYTKKDRVVVNPTTLDAYQTEPNVYGLSPLLTSTGYGTHFFYGGMWRRS